MIYKTLLILHVIAGFTGLASGLAAMIVKKSRGIHTQAGKVYYLGMYASGITALIMTIIKFNPFLLAIGIFTLYLVYSGKQAIAYWRVKEPWSLRFNELAPSLTGILVALFMIGYPFFQMIMEGRFFVPVLGIFGIVLFINALQDLMMLRKVSNRVPRNKKFLLQHIGKMGGSYIAATTAFLVNNVSFDPGWVVWLLPTFVGSFLIANAIRQWKVRLRIQ